MTKQVQCYVNIKVCIVTEDDQVLVGWSFVIQVSTRSQERLIYS